MVGRVARPVPGSRIRGLLAGLGVKGPALAVLLAGCGAPASSRLAGGGGVDSASDSPDSPDSPDSGDSPEVLTVDYAGRLVTVSGDAFGVPAPTLQDASIGGFFAYNANVADGDESRDAWSARLAGVGFSGTFAGVELGGSGKATVTVIASEDRAANDCFYFEDGPSPTEPDRRMTVGGASSETAAVWIALCAEGLAASGEAPPDPFLWLDPSMPHTFSLTEGGGTALAQLDSIAVR